MPDPVLVAGIVVGSGALLLIAGASKIYRNRRPHSDASAIAAALRIGAGRWRWVELAAGGFEFGTGVAAIAGFQPIVTGAAMAAQGAVFTGLLAYARHARIPGECGCVRRARRTGPQITPGVLARAAWLVVAGAVNASIRSPRPPAGSGTWYEMVALGAAVLLIALSADWSWPTRICRRRLWFPTRRTVTALIEHRAFAAMAAAGGPFSDDYAHRRSGCTDEFWFTTPVRPGSAVAFRVDRSRPLQPLAVNAAVEPGIPSDVTHRRIDVQHRLAATR